MIEIRIVECATPGADSHRAFPQLARNHLAVRLLTGHVEEAQPSGQQSAGSRGGCLPCDPHIAARHRPDSRGRQRAIARGEYAANPGIFVKTASILVPA